MVGDIFRSKFKKDPRDFGSTGEVNRFVEKRTGKKLKIEYVNRDISSSRGSVFDVQVLDADQVFEKALRK